MQLILCLECNGKNRSDFLYVKNTLDHYYNTWKNDKIIYVYSGGKSELINQEKKILNYIKNYRGKTRTIIVADYDREDDILNQKIEQYATDTLMDIVWMNRDIEEVYWGKRVEKKEKEEFAKKFEREYTYKLCNAKNLGEEEPLKKISSSNILCIFDKYLERKNIV